MPGKPINKNRLDAIYRYIVAYKSAHDGNSPTIRQIGAQIGVQSTSVISYYLDYMVRQGRIEKDGPHGICVPGGMWTIGA